MARKDLILHPKKAKGEDGYRIFSIRIPEKTVLRLEEIARQTNRSRNEVIGLLLDHALDHCVIEEETDQ